MRNSQSWSTVNSVRIGLILMLISLAIFTGYQFYRSHQSYAVQVFKTPTGWGYNIVNNGNVFIHQPTLPGQSGRVGFSSQEQARRVGERVVEKIQQTQSLPTLTNDELRQLGVTIP